jgi:hypothetical protein
MAAILNWLARARMLLGCGLCAFVVYHLVWLMHSPDPWQLEPIFWVFGLLCFSPLLVLAWSLWPKSSDHVKAYVLVRYTFFFHVFLALTLAAILDPEWAIPCILGVLMDLVLLGLGPWRTEDPASLQFYRKGHLVFSGGVLACLLTWSYINIGIVAWNAESTATGKPYCLQIPFTRSNDYKEATSLHDLRGLTMQALYWKDITSNFHAVLVVKNGDEFSWYNWSYRQLRFTRIALKALESGVIGMSEPSCKLRPHFIQTLSFFKF